MTNHKFYAGLCAVLFVELLFIAVMVKRDQDHAYRMKQLELQCPAPAASSPTRSHEVLP